MEIEGYPVTFDSLYNIFSIILTVIGPLQVLPPSVCDLDTPAVEY